MIIYIYGASKFKNKIESILIKARLGLKIETVNTPLRLKSIIEAKPREIFIIDEDKILKDSFFTRKFRFLYSSESIEKTFIDKYGIGDVCFNSINSMISFIQNRIAMEQQQHEKDKNSQGLNQESQFFDPKLKPDDFENDKNVEIQDEIEERDLSSLKDIDELLEGDIENNMFEDLKK